MNEEKVWTAEEQKAHRALWVEALRSGRFEQTQGALRHGAAMCCLGVACEVSGLGTWDAIGSSALHDYVVGEESFGDVLPHPVQAWLGLADNGGENWVGPALYELNDDHHRTFAEIADIIEAEPEGLIPEASS